MDFVTSSQPLQDGEDVLDACWIPSDFVSVESDQADVITSSQPFDDGEDLLQDAGLQVCFLFIFFTENCQPGLIDTGP
jgi:hypothetical protein